MLPVNLSRHSSILAWSSGNIMISNKKSILYSLINVFDNKTVLRWIIYMVICYDDKVVQILFSS